MSIEFWNWRVSEPTGIAEFARRSEAQGWDGIGLGDSQSLTGEPYVCLAVGADPRRIAWGIETAREAAQRAGRNPDTLSFGAYVNVVCEDDPAVGRELGRPSTGLFARFSAMYGEVAGPTDENQDEVFHDLHHRYDMNLHGRAGGHQITALTDDFMDGYAIVGSAGYCADRLAELEELGVTKFGIIGPDFARSTVEAAASAARFTADVLPLLRGSRN